jgi:hypothetical protein
VDVVIFRSPARGSQGRCSSSRCCCRTRGEEWWTVLGADPPYQVEARGSKRQPPTRYHGFLATTSRYSTSMATVPSVARLNWSTTSSSWVISAL